MRRAVPYSNRAGFTIVELLIVIVVIAILAAIVLVSYNGVSNRATDTAVQSDLKTFASKVAVFNVDNSRCGDESTGAGYAIIALSKSGTKYISTSTNPGIQTYTGVYAGGASTCSAQSASFTSWKWGVNTSGVQGF